MYKNVLIPVDGSKCSQAALDHGVKLAKTVGANISLLHILEDPLTIAYSLPETVSYQPELYSELKAAALAILEKAEKQVRAEGVDCVSDLISDANPAHAILEASKEADLIIMGTHGRKGLDRFVFGSVTEGVLRRSDKPVLILRCA